MNIKVVEEETGPATEQETGQGPAVSGVHTDPEPPTAAFRLYIAVGGHINAVDTRSSANTASTARSPGAGGGSIRARGYMRGPDCSASAQRVDLQACKDPRRQGRRREHGEDRSRNRKRQSGRRRWGKPRAMGRPGMLPPSLVPARKACKIPPEVLAAATMAWKKTGTADEEDDGEEDE
eukprot:g4402.t1